MTELWSTSEIIRRFGLPERWVRDLLSRDDAPRPILVSGRKRYKRAEVEARLENLPPMTVTKR
jgi:hypothetical protein